MKPDNAMEFEISPDLCGYWAYKAHDMIYDTLECPMNKVHFSLEICSINMGEACKIGYLIDIPVTVNFEYREDEWSLTGYYFNDENRTVKSVVWSPGA